MKIDLYTKIILTGIFACLCLVLLRDVGFEKRAEAALNRTDTVTIDGTVDVRLIGIAANRRLGWENIDVKVKNWPLPNP